MRDEEFRALLFLAAFLLLVGTGFYHRHEGWTVIDSAFFSLITLTTVGYGNLLPTTTLSKIFTISPGKSSRAVRNAGRGGAAVVRGSPRRAYENRRYLRACEGVTRRTLSTDWRVD